MRSRLLALALAATAFVPATPASAAIHYTERCEPKFDSMCYYDFCGIADCTRSDCHVFYDQGGYNTGFCVGVARPRQGDPAS